MRKKWDRKGNIWKESNLDPFVLKSDHSRRNCDTAMRRGRSSARAKNTVAFRRNNKKRKANDAWKHSQLQRISTRLVSLSTVCRIQVKVSKTNSVRGRWKWQQMVHFLCFVIQWEARVWFTRGLCSARSTVISCHLSQQSQGHVFQTGGHLSSPHPSLWYLSQACHAPPWRSCRHVTSPPERKHSAAPWV